MYKCIQSGNIPWMNKKLNATYDAQKDDMDAAGFTEQ